MRTTFLRSKKEFAFQTKPSESSLSSGECRNIVPLEQNPAASTKREQTALVVVCFLFAGVGDENFTLRSRMEFAFQSKPWGARSPKASDRNIHLW